MIEIRDVHKLHRRNQTEVRALQGVTCTINKGTTTFIVGPSGSGKSTLLYLIGTLDSITSGSISIQGKEIGKFNWQEREQFRRESIGFVFQNFNLLSNLSALENVLIPYFPIGTTGAKLKEAKELLARVGLAERIDHRPSQLSGGEQQRVALARALLKKPLLVLADEPTGELDSQTGAEIFRYLRDLQREMNSTVIVVTHDQSHILPGDQVITLRDGRVLTSESRTF